MSEVRPDIDLGGLARQASAVEPPRRSPWRILLPLLILLAFGVTLATSLTDVFGSRTAVTVVRPRPMQAGGETPAGAAKVVLQAAGWIEPDPFPIHVSALAGGVVREVLVREAARVKRGEVLARLIDDDAKLALARARAELAQAEAALAEAEARAGSARTAFESALAVTESEASARAELEGRRAELANRRAAVGQGEAGVRVARDELALQQELAAAGAGEERLVDLAGARMAEAEGGLEILRAGVELARAEEAKAVARFTRATREVELRLEDKLAVDSSAALLARAAAEVASARVGVEEASLRLARMEVVSPIDGVVLERLSAPGTVLDPAGTALVCTLFDPAHLRVRVDVPQGDVSKLRSGGAAEIGLDARPNAPYRGTIARVVERADIQKVTLQVHVVISDADEWVRPEMLAQVRFLGGDAAPGAHGSAGSPAQRVEIPARLVDSEQRVWIVDGALGTAQLRRIETGVRSGDWIEVLEGLDVSDKLIDEGRDGLEVGERLRVEQRP